MSDLDQAVAALKERIAAAQRARARAEHERDAAQARADTAREQLQRDFGVSTVDDAKAMLARLETELSNAVTQLRVALTEIGV